MSAPLQRDSVRRTLSHDVSRCTRPRDGSSTSCEVTYASASAHLNCAFEQTLHRSVAYNTTEAHDFAGRLDCAGSAMRAFFHIKCKPQRPPCSVNLINNATYPDLLRVGHPKFSDPSVDIAPRKSFLPLVARVVIIDTAFVVLRYRSFCGRMQR